jgi:uncharacterized membrane protein (UPF0127 family)
MISLSVKRADHLITKTIGLIGAKKAYPLFLQTRFGIHTFGLRFPIDVVILDQTYHIVKVKKSLPPNRIFLWPPIWFYVLELPVGVIQAKKLHIGDQIKLTF